MQLLKTRKCNVTRTDNVDPARKHRHENWKFCRYYISNKLYKCDHYDRKYLPIYQWSAVECVHYHLLFGACHFQNIGLEKGQTSGLDCKSGFFIYKLWQMSKKFLYTTIWTNVRSYCTNYWVCNLKSRSVYPIWDLKITINIISSFKSKCCNVNSSESKFICLLKPGVESPIGQGGPGSYWYMWFLKVKDYEGPPSFLVAQGDSWATPILKTLLSPWKPIHYLKTILTSTAICPSISFIHLSED